MTVWELQSYHTLTISVLRLSLCFSQITHSSKFAHSSTWIQSKKKKREFKMRGLVFLFVKEISHFCASFSFLSCRRLFCGWEVLLHFYIFKTREWISNVPSRHVPYVIILVIYLLSVKAFFFCCLLKTTLPPAPPASDHIIAHSLDSVQRVIAVRVRYSQSCENTVSKWWPFLNSRSNMVSLQEASQCMIPVEH